MAEDSLDTVIRTRCSRVEDSAHLRSRWLRSEVIRVTGYPLLSATLSSMCHTIGRFSGLVGQGRCRRLPAVFTWRRSTCCDATHMSFLVLRGFREECLVMSGRSAGRARRSGPPRARHDLGMSCSAGKADTPAHFELITKPSAVSMLNTPQDRRMERAKILAAEWCSGCPMLSQVNPSGDFR